MYRARLLNDLTVGSHFHRDSIIKLLLSRSVVHGRYSDIAWSQSQSFGTT